MSEESAALVFLVFFCAGTYGLYRIIEKAEVERRVEANEYKKLYERFVTAYEQKDKK